MLLEFSKLVIRKTSSTSNVDSLIVRLSREVGVCQHKAAITVIA